MTDLLDNAIQAYRHTFGEEPTVVASAPGRVNLIGEHTDYNEGLVLPAAIDRRVYVAAGMRHDQQVLIFSSSYNTVVTTTLDALGSRQREGWANYPKGVLSLIQERGCKLSGLNLLISSSVPEKAGLSSSAALEVATAFAVLELFQFPMDPTQLARLCQKAENDFVGVSCGTMDQFAAVFGKKGYALFLDCRSLHSEFVPFPEGVLLLVCDTGVKRELGSTEYGRRQEECRLAVEELSRYLPGIRSLRDVDEAAFLQHENLLDPTLRKRARHVVSENTRVRAAVEDLKNNDLDDFSKLIYQSHLSLKRDYEVSTRELDAVVDIAASTDGVIGARMTGAGFGGSAICFVMEENCGELKSNLEEMYPHITGLQPQLYICEIDDGAKVEWRR